MARPLLVTGASGYVGRALVAHLRHRGDDVCAWTGREGGPDVRDEAAVRACVHDLRPRMVLHLVAAQADAAAQDLHATNVAGARHVALASARIGARLVHLSSDMVHDGTAAPYGDDAPARPVTPYGRSKAAGEEAVLAAHPEALVVRTSLVIDPREPDRATQGFLQRARAGDTVTLFSDEVRSAVDRSGFVRALVDLAATSARGRLNVAGPVPCTRQALGEAFLRQALGPHGLRSVRVCTRAEAGVPERPADLTLDSTRAYALLGRPLPAPL
ncbi:MAG: NAD(P)-dependent oxidoreductase [Planctomycetota bacterium]